MCNLYSQTRGVEAIRRLFKVGHNRATGVEPQSAIFPGWNGSVIRKAEDGERKLVTMSWWHTGNEAITPAIPRFENSAAIEPTSSNASHGFSIAELFGAKRPEKSKSVAKYANPEDKSDTWTGRGRKPNWLVARLKKGADLAQFEI
jgi:hypothetical protein